MAPSKSLASILSSATFSSACSSFVFTPAMPGMAPAPGASTNSTGGFGWPMVRMGTWPTEGEKPGAEAVSFHVPARRPMIENRPLSSVVAENEGGDAAGFSATTVAPFSGWPLSSLTTPPTRPVWANAGSAPSSTTTRAASDSFSLSRIVVPLLENRKTYGVYANSPVSVPPCPCRPRPPVR